MKRPAIFFDRDNTLIVSDGYLGDAGKVVLVEGAADAVAKARQYGFRVLTFSNQSGVARGMFTEEDVQAVNRRMDELLQQANPAAAIERHEYCPDHPEATVEKYRRESPRRKPAPGMLLEAAAMLSLDLSRSWVIGDAPRDIEAGHAAGCRTILFAPPDLAPSPAAGAASDVRPDFMARSLKEAIEIIARETFRPTALARAAAAIQPASDPQLHNMAVSAAEEDARSAREVLPAAPAGPSSGGAASMPPAERADAPRTMGAPAASSATKSSDLSDGRTAGLDAVPNGNGEHLPAGDGGSEQEASVMLEPDSPDVADDARLARVERLLGEILAELRQQRPAPGDFSVTKLLATISQVMALGALFVAYLCREGQNLVPLLLAGIALETLTIALLIMGRQRGG